MSIYDEAVVDAQKLREVAENAAKQQILEAITPRIREMINSRILKEQDEDIDISDTDEEIDDALDSIEDETNDSAVVAASTPVAAVPSPVKSGSSVVINNTGDIHIESDADGDEPILTDQMAESLARLIRNEKKQKDLVRRIENLDRNQKLFTEALTRLMKRGKLSASQKRKVQDTYHTLAQEAKALHSEMPVVGGGSQRLEGKLIETMKEMKIMSKKTKNIFDFLFEGEEDEGKMNKQEANKGSREDEGLDEAELVMSDEEISGLADKDEDELSDALAGLNLSFETEDEDEAAGEEVDMGDEDVEGDEGDESDELDLGEMDAHEGMEETVYEIDEAALRRELGKMTRLRESRKLDARKLREARARRARMVRENAATEKINQFGGAEEIGDVFYDVDEDSLINVLADELGSVSGKGVQESARIQKVMQEAAQYKKAAETLKKQLVEMNLFNAKLLYANKLMQNKDLTVKQQRAIVEALDNAKTLREAKLLYKSLSESLARRAQKSGSLSEGTTRTVLGSSSRSTRSAQPASNGAEVDRWAVLAGLPGEK